jgi:tyrosyl-tRNA synthetase
MFSGDATSLSESDLAQLSLDGLPSSAVTRDAFPETLTQLLTDAGMANSGKQVKDALGRAAVSINGRPISSEDNGNPAGCFTVETALHGRYFITRLGKKKVHLFIVE